MKDDIMVIIPVHVYDSTVETLLKRAIESVPKELEITLSVSTKISDKLEGYSKLYNNVTVITSIDKNEPDDFCTLVNRAVEVIGMKWFSILEFDDEYTEVWLPNMRRYMKENPEYTVFLPLTELLNYSDGKFVGYGNEAPWATSFSNALGMIDNDCLQQFFDFYMTGGVYNTDEWKSCGGLKPSIKLTFWYEFLLRITNNDKIVYVVPKLGYKHYTNRDGSLYNTYSETVDSKESEFWFELAKKECFFKEDRKKTYENKAEKGE